MVRVDANEEDRRPVEPERSLVAQVMIHAFRTVHKLDAARSYEILRDCEWFDSEPSDEPFSFYWCCEVLGIEPGSILKRRRVVINGRAYYFRLPGPDMCQRVSLIHAIELRYIRDKEWR